MSVDDLRKILAALPGDARVHIGQDGNDETVQTVTVTKDMKTVLVCQDNGGVLPSETVLYDATPEQRD